MFAILITPTSLPSPRELRQEWEDWQERRNNRPSTMAYDYDDYNLYEDVSCVTYTDTIYKNVTQNEENALLTFLLLTFQYNSQCCYCALPV